MLDLIQLLKLIELNIPCIESMGWIRLWKELSWVND